MKLSANSCRLLIAGAALALTACATVQAPLADAPRAADISVANADKDHAADFAPLEMRSVREKLAAAHQTPKVPYDQSAVHERRLADEAHADAELATARACAARADASISGCKNLTTPCDGNDNAAFELETWIISVI